MAIKCNKTNDLGKTHNQCVCERDDDLSVITADWVLSVTMSSVGAHCRRAIIGELTIPDFY